MTTGDWGLVLQVVATLAAAVAAIAAWQSVVGVSRERKADARLRADEHLKHIHALITEWNLLYYNDRGLAFAVWMALRSEVHVVTDLEGPLPRCLELVNTEHWTIKPDDLPGLVEAAIDEVEDARTRIWNAQ